MKKRRIDSIEDTEVVVFKSRNDVLAFCWKASFYNISLRDEESYLWLLNEIKESELEDVYLHAISGIVGRLKSVGDKFKVVSAEEFV